MLNRRRLSSLLLLAAILVSSLGLTFVPDAQAAPAASYPGSSDSYVTSYEVYQGYTGFNDAVNVLGAPDYAQAYAHTSEAQFRQEYRFESTFTLTGGSSQHIDVYSNHATTSWLGVYVVNTNGDLFTVGNQANGLDRRQTFRCEQGGGGFSVDAWCNETIRGVVIAAGANQTVDIPDAIGLSGGSFAPTPTPTPTVVPTATTMPVRAFACLDESVATAIPGPTQFGTAWPTATATVTPTGTYTPPATPTGTPQPGQQFTLRSTFDTSLSPWTLGDTPPSGETVQTHWDSAEPSSFGTTPGVAVLGDSYNAAHGNQGHETTGWLNDLSIEDALVFSAPDGMLMPVRLVGSAKVDGELLANQHVYLSVLYWTLDVDIDAYGESPAQHGAWYINHASDVELSTAWAPFSMRLSELPPDQVEHPRVTAIALLFHSANDGYAGAAMVDNLQILAGAAADNSLPICPGGTARPAAVATTKFCSIKTISVDVYAACVAPDDLDVAGWLFYVYCRLVRYFQFLPQNTDQVNALSSRQSETEPIGSMIEFGPVVGMVRDVVADLAAAQAQVNYYAYDWSTLLTLGQSISTPPVLNAAPDLNWMDECSATIRNISGDLQRGACFAVYIIRTKSPGVLIIQWAFNIFALLGVYSYFSSKWFTKNG